jgi:hypothetical protein
MDQQIFSSLPAKKRCDLLWEEGQYLASVKYYRFKASLYAFKSFFVEILCYPGSADVENIEIANDEKLLKYLNRIDVQTLLENKAE